MFDTVINAPSSNISYNPATGDFTITQLGNYYIAWWVNTDGAGAETNVVFGIRVTTGGPQQVMAASPSPITTLQLSGNALLTVSANPTVISLFNDSGETVNYASSPIQANLVIVEVG